MPTNASIGIFNQEIKPPDNNTKPLVPKEVFEAAIRVAENKSCELVRTNTGIYIVDYSEFGPFQSKVNDDWMPVYIAKPEKWRSGGIKLSELENFKDKKE